jgi:ketosteroid isomerase-like protein
MDLDALTDRFFVLSAAADGDGVVAMCADDGRFKQNFGEEGGVDTLRALVEGTGAAGIAVAYSDVRRLVTESAVTEQHTVTLTRTDGVQVASDVCVVLRFDDRGLITRLDEYVDTAAFAPIFG